MVRNPRESPPNVAGCSGLNMKAFGNAATLGGMVMLCGSMLAGLGSAGAATVQVDLRPCIFVPRAIVSGNTVIISIVIAIRRISLRQQQSLVGEYFCNVAPGVHGTINK